MHAPEFRIPRLDPTNRHGRKRIGRLAWERDLNRGGVLRCARMWYNTYTGRQTHAISYAVLVLHALGIIS